MNNFVVSKFGGTSMGTISAMISSAKICQEHKSNIVVVSATSGTTDQLIQIVSTASRGENTECAKLVYALKERHNTLLTEAGETISVKSSLDNLYTELDLLIQNISLLKELTPKANDHILSLGERLSSVIFIEVLQRQLPDTKVVLLDARSVIKTDSNFGKATPLIEVIAQKCSEIKNDCVYVTQGFIGSDMEGNTTILGRGGSDYSAALFAEGMNASILEIWTDVAGIATTDPRICSEAKIIPEITYAEAAEMAQYGAKVLHPATIAPAIRKGIPVFVGSTFESKLPGTWIKKDVDFKPAVRAITKRGLQSLLTITNPNMLNAYGFMQEIFGIFGRHRISVDCVTTSEISIAITVDTSTLKNDQFMQDLGSVGQIEVESGYSLISLIGNDLVQRGGLARTIFSSMEETTIRMMGFGASPYNFNFLIKDEVSNNCIQKLHRALL